MKWRLVDIVQETNHPFLNYFTMHYEVENEGKTRPYSYFLASRHTKEELRALTKDYARPDGVLLALYKIDEVTKEVSILLTKQFRPAIGAYVTSFAAGLLDKDDESDIDAARREAIEEVGYTIDDIERLAPSCPTSTGLSDEMVSFLLARIVKKVDNNLEAFEDISSEFVSLEELKRRLDDPQYFFPMNIRLVCLLLLARFSH